MLESRLKNIAAFSPVAGDKPACPWLWIGTWSMGGAGYGRADQRLCRQTIELAIEKGVRHFDTAGFYARGGSERLLAKCLSTVRGRLFISSKAGLVWDGNRVLHRAAPEDLEAQLFESLDRLDTDYLDLFQLHWPDPEVPLDESLSALEDLREKGLVRFTGAGNLAEWQVMECLPPGKRLPLQTTFNPCRMDAMELLKAAHGSGRAINCITSPFEQGLLVSPRFLETSPGKKDVRSRNPLFYRTGLRPILREYFRCLEQAGFPPASFLLLWLLGHEEIDIVIPGPRTPAQLQDILHHLGWLEKHAGQGKDLHGLLGQELGSRVFQLLDMVSEAAA